MIGSAGVVFRPKNKVVDAREGGYSEEKGADGSDVVEEAALGRWALLITALVSAARKVGGAKVSSQDGGQAEGLEQFGEIGDKSTPLDDSFGPIDYQGIQHQNPPSHEDDELLMYGGAQELKDLHKDLHEAKYTQSEIEEAVPPLQFLYQSKQQRVHEPEGDGLSSLDDFDDDAFFRDNKPFDSEERAPSLDALFYDDSGYKASRKKKKYKRRDWESLLPPGGPRRSGRVKARSVLSMFAGMEEASI